jgi:hypothetical protein
MLDLDNVPQVTGRFDHKSFKRACLQKNVNPHNRGADQLLLKVRNWRTRPGDDRLSLLSVVRCLPARVVVHSWGIEQRLSTAARARWRRRAAVHRAAQLARWPHWEKIGNRGQLRSLTFNERLSSASASSADGGTLPFKMCR